MAAHHLLEIADGLRTIAADAEALCSRLDDERLCRRPAPAKWSVAECIVHLTMSSAAYLPIWRTALANSATRNSHVPAQVQRRYRLDLQGRILVWTMKPPPKFRVAASAGFHPVDVGPADRILPDFLESQRQVLAILVEADGLPIERMKVRSPFDQRLSYSVWSSFVVAVAHQRRHLWQAERAAAAIAGWRL